MVMRTSEHKAIPRIYLTRAEALNMEQLRQNDIPCSKARSNSSTPQATVPPDCQTLSLSHNIQHPYCTVYGGTWSTVLYDDLFVTNSSDGTLKPLYC